MAKAKKNRVDKYDEKLKIDGTFEEVIGESADKPVKDNRPKEQKEDVLGTDHDGLKKQDKPIK